MDKKRVTAVRVVATIERWPSRLQQQTASSLIKSYFCGENEIFGFIGFAGACDE